MKTSFFLFPLFLLKGRLLSCSLLWCRLVCFKRWFHFLGLMESQSVIIRMKATEQYLLAVVFIARCKSSAFDFIFVALFVDLVDFGFWYGISVKCNCYSKVQIPRRDRICLVVRFCFTRMRQTLKQGLEENSLMRLLVPRERFLSERFVSSLEYHDVLIS